MRKNEINWGLLAMTEKIKETQGFAQFGSKNIIFKTFVANLQGIVIHVSSLT